MGQFNGTWLSLGYYRPLVRLIRALLSCDGGTDEEIGQKLLSQREEAG